MENEEKRAAGDNFYTFADATVIPWRGVSVENPEVDTNVHARENM